MQNSDRALPRKKIWQNPISNLFCIPFFAKASHRFACFSSIMVKCIRTHFHTQPISEWLSVHLDRYVETVWLPEYCFHLSAGSDKNHAGDST